MNGEMASIWKKSLLSSLVGGRAENLIADIIWENDSGWSEQS
jgi:hypothetical protein